LSKCHRGKKPKYLKGHIGDLDIFATPPSEQFDFGQISRRGAEASTRRHPSAPRSSNPTSTEVPTSTLVSGQPTGTTDGVSKSPDEIKQKIKEQVEALTEACKTQSKITGVVVKDTNEKCALGRLIRECFVKHGAKYNGEHFVETLQQLKIMLLQHLQLLGTWLLQHLQLLGIWLLQHLPLIQMLQQL
ncbi:unnamed protein product, partial [Nesidiocoris tenuis]